MTERRKVSAALAAFRDELAFLRRLDDQNQLRFYPGPGRPSRDRLTSRQMYMLAEAILVRAFTRYEKFLEEVFILYCQGKSDVSGGVVGSYLTPTGAPHARSLLKSGMRFLEWSDADSVISRCQTYLKPDSPIEIGIRTNRARLTNIRRTRNSIAHDSAEAVAQFRAVVRVELGVLPPRAVAVGEFLTMNDRNAPQPQYILRSYLDVLDSVAGIASG